MTQVQKIKDTSYFRQVSPTLKDADFIILQNIQLPDKDPFVHVLQSIPPHAKIIFIDSLYVTFYHPELIKLSNIASFKMGMLHDANVLKAFIQNIPLEKFFNIDPFYESSFYDHKIYHKKYSESLAELEKRQNILFSKKAALNIENKSFHIDIAPFIKERFIKSKTISWADHNHPRLDVFKFIITNLLKIMNLPDRIDLIDKTYNLYNFQNIHRPPYASTVEFFNLKSNNKEMLYSLGSAYKGVSREKYVHNAYEHYKTLNKDNLEKICQSRLLM